ncbi:hypothetical protein YC2023_098916 [Brassica napus]
MANDHTTPIIILSKLYNNKNKTFRRLYYRLYHRLRHRLCHHFCVVSVISTIVPVVSASSISLSPHRLRRCLRVVSIVTSSHRPSISCLSIYESSSHILVGCLRFQLIRCLLLLFNNTHQSKKLGLSLEEKREKMLQIFYDSQDFFLLKELEKMGPKKGVIS